jgi:Arc/MetJ-type ribon-helix-helix transcriptional regulator
MRSPDQDGVNDYLWDASGAADPEVARLEQLLVRYRQAGPLRELSPLERARWWEVLFASRAFRMSALAGAAALLLLLVGPWAVRHLAYPGDSCGAQCLVGTARIDGRSLGSAGILRAGSVLETDAASQAEVRIGLIGRVTVHPNSRMRWVEMRPGRYRMALERGKISARTLAPPFTFVVDTPGPTAYDVGCAFTLETDEHGSGLLSVTSGWVQLEIDYRQVLIPAGAASQLRPGGNLGTPYFTDASEAFRSALARLDFEQQDAATRLATLNELLVAARSRDVYSFMEMLRMATGEERRRLIDRGMELLPPPPGVTRTGLLRGDEAMMHAWRKQLGLPEVKRWWLHWRDILPASD